MYLNKCSSELRWVDDNFFFGLKEYQVEVSFDHIQGFILFGSPMVDDYYVTETRHFPKHMIF